jgi:8-oxo-dGTP pyrophosphatase MutT (NUDIX family)
MQSAHFLSDTSPLKGDNAAAALIVAEDGRYLLQLRDDIPGIFYPGHWGCFGGAVGPEESPLDALKRELAEELEFEARNCRAFVSFDFDLTLLGQRKLYRNYYEVSTTESIASQFVLHEGVAMRFFSPDEIFRLANLTPYDSFAIWLHVARSRFSST